MKNIHEDKIITFSNFDFDNYTPSKYNSNIIIKNITEWLMSKLLNLTPNIDNFQYNLNDFIKEVKLDPDKFFTFYKELQQNNKLENYNINIKNDIIYFFNIKNNIIHENN